MGIIQLCNLLGSIIEEYINPIQFPNEKLNGNDTPIKLEVTTGMIEQGGVFDFNIELGVKALHPKDAERMCINMINKLHRVSDVEHEGHQLILCLAEKPHPTYEGIMEDGTYYFTCNFRLLTCIM